MPVGGRPEGRIKAEIEEKDPSAEPSAFQLSAFNFQLFCSHFNFGPALTSNRTVAQLVQELLKHTGGEWLDTSDPDAVHEASKLNLATDKAFHLLQWLPVWSFEETVAATADWYATEQLIKDTRKITSDHIRVYHLAAAAKGLAWAQE